MFKAFFGWIIIFLLGIAIVFGIWSAGSESYREPYLIQFAQDATQFITDNQIEKNYLGNEDAWQNRKILLQTIKQMDAHLENVKNIDFPNELEKIQQQAFEDTLKLCQLRKSKLYCRFVAWDLRQFFRSPEYERWMELTTSLFDSEIRYLQLQNDFAQRFWADYEGLNDPSTTEKAYEVAMRQYQKTQDLGQEAARAFPLKAKKQKTESSYSGLILIALIIGIPWAIFFLFGIKSMLSNIKKIGQIGQSFSFGRAIKAFRNGFRTTLLELYYRLCTYETQEDINKKIAAHNVEGYDSFDAFGGLCAIFFLFISIPGSIAAVIFLIRCF